MRHHEKKLARIGLREKPSGGPNSGGAAAPASRRTTSVQHGQRIWANGTENDGLGNERDSAMTTARRGGSLFGTGVYDLLLAAHLLGIDERNLRRWSSPARSGAMALVPPTHGWAFSFHDLLSLAVVAVLRQRGVTTAGVRTMIRELEAQFDYARPLAHAHVVEGLATVGTSVISAKDGVDLTKAGQRVLLQTIKRYLRPIEYGSDNLARLWRPASRILVNPEVQVGHPCIASTRVTTATVSGRVAQGEQPEAIAEDLGVSLADVRAAVAFERRLDAGEGLALVA
jgi:uncharacterized protein (DUF433 family)/DNA-binding transcriptional MerR regulator